LDPKHIKLPRAIEERHCAEWEKHPLNWHKHNFVRFQPASSVVVINYHRIRCLFAQAHEGGMMVQQLHAARRSGMNTAQIGEEIA
jgi:hypothetical protein